MASGKLDVGEISNVQTKYQWRVSIDQIRSVEKKGIAICSPTFTTSPTKTKKNLWHLSLYPKGNSDSSNGYMALFLSSDNDDDYITVTFTLSFLTNNREVIRTRRYENKKIKTKSGHGSTNYVLEFYLLNPINNLIEDNKITIVCNINENCSGDEKINQNKLHTCQQMNENIFKNINYSDVTIIASDGVEFFLHKCVLAQQSSVFKAMFDTDMLEKDNNLVKIDDFDSAVLNRFFKYLYTGQSSYSRTRDLLIVAEKYNVQKLKDECEVSMSLDVKISNALDYFKVAEMNNAEKLRSNMIRYMAFNLEKLQEEPDYQTLTVEQLREIIECQFKLSKE